MKKPAKSSARSRRSRRSAPATTPETVTRVAQEAAQAVVSRQAERHVIDLVDYRHDAELYIDGERVDLSYDLNEASDIVNEVITALVNAVAPNATFNRHDLQRLSR